MKKELRVHIYRYGSENEAILRMIANHNSGEVSIHLETIEAYIKARQAQYPVIYKDKFVSALSKDLDTLDISEDGFKTFTLQIKEVTVLELDESIEENPIYNIQKNKL